jgi:hypothetical protein
MELDDDTGVSGGPSAGAPTDRPSLGFAVGGAAATGLLAVVLAHVDPTVLSGGPPAAASSVWLLAGVLGAVLYAVAVVGGSPLRSQGWTAFMFFGWMRGLSPLGRRVYMTLSASFLMALGLVFGLR